MGYKDFDALDSANGENQTGTITLDGNSPRVDLPDASFVKDSVMSRDSMDLVLEGPKGKIIVEDYFAQADAPSLVAPDGSTLTPNLVESFVQSNPLYADAGSMTDESPIGAVQELTGDATVTRTDGTTDTLEIGSPIYQGDIIETSQTGAVNITFVDESSFAVSEDARLAIDEYVFDPSTAESVTNFSVLKGMFVYTSGLIGREDPDDVNIETPVGSIGIRGTIIAGDVDNGEITVVEGAIVLRDPAGNEMTLATQFETARFDPAGGQIQNMGQQSAQQVMGRFTSISNVSPNLFSSINDVANTNDDGQQNTENTEGQPQEATEQSLDNNQDGQIDGTVDEDGDGSADGTVEESDGSQDGEQQNQGESGEAVEPAGEQTTQDGAQENASGDRITQQQQPTSEPLASGLGGNTLDGAKTSFGTNTTTSGTGARATSKTTLQATTESGTKPPPPPSDTFNTAPDGTTASNNLPPPPSGTNTSTAFRLTFTPIAVNENVDGALIGRISSVNGQISTLSLQGNGGAYFDLVQVGANLYELYQQSGVQFDFETNHNYLIGFDATSTDGQTHSSLFSPTINDVNEMPYYLDQASEGMFSATSNSSISYNFRQEFFDQDAGDNIGMQYRIVVRDATNTTDLFVQDYDGSITGGLTGPVAGVTFNSDTGMFNINFAMVMADDAFSVEVFARDPDGLEESTGIFELDYYVPVSDGTFNAGSGSVDGNDIYHVPGVVTSSFTISGTDNKVFFGNSADSNVYMSGGTTNNLIHLGDGNDSIIVSDGASGNDIVGGGGNDVFTVQDFDNIISGDEGNDLFELDLDNGTNIMADLAAGSGGLGINGGSESLANPFHINFSTRIFNGNGDVLKFLYDGQSAVATGQGSTIDFSFIDHGLIRNIEILDFDNTDDNTVTLRHQDVFAMTDEKRTLVIRGDSSDTLNFDTEGAQWHGGDRITDSATGDDYDTYFIDGITLLVDTDMTTTIT